MKTESKVTGQEVCMSSAGAFRVSMAVGCGLEKGGEDDLRQLHQHLTTPEKEGARRKRRREWERRRQERFAVKAGVRFL